jgi:hypothetical protein
MSKTENKGGIAWGDSTQGARPILPKLTVDVVREAMQSPEARRVVLTVEIAYLQRFASGDQLFVEFREFPGFALQCNKTQASAFRRLVSAGILPDEQDEDSELRWGGKPIPLVVHDFTFENETVQKWVPVHPDDYKRELASAAKAGGAKRAK